MIVRILVYTLLILLAIILLCRAAIALEKKCPGEKFDEMQTLSRLRSYRLAFWTGAIYFLFIFPVLIRQVDGLKTIEPVLLLAGGFILQMLVCQTYALLTHAALPLGDNPLVAIGSNAFIGLTQLLIFRNGLNKYHLLGNPVELALVGRSSILWFHLIVAFYFFYIALLHTIQLIRDWKE